MTRRPCFHLIPTWLDVVRRAIGKFISDSVTKGFPVDVWRILKCNPLFEVIVGRIIRTTFTYSSYQYLDTAAAAVPPTAVLTFRSDQRYSSRRAASTMSTTSRHSIYSTYAATLFHLHVLSPHPVQLLNSTWHATTASAQRQPDPLRCLLLIACTIDTSPLTKLYSWRVLLCLAAGRSSMQLCRSRPS